MTITKIIIIIIIIIKIITAEIIPIILAIMI